MWMVYDLEMCMYISRLHHWCDTLCTARLVMSLDRGEVSGACLVAGGVRDEHRQRHGGLVGLRRRTLARPCVRPRIQHPPHLRIWRVMRAHGC